MERGHTCNECARFFHSIMSPSFRFFPGPGHFRKFPTEVPGVGELTVSSLGLGTYLGPETDAADQEYQEAVARSLPLGINVFDAYVLLFQKPYTVPYR